ncbi:30S ribosomal protein S16 [Candidatus Purcelliella pentastirinorum]|uniref:Small ribosomal subunit protein bS16 n=1 Tax=Candidatus Purcelliella pentastirinorum TaxID=472834 RepID=A0AAX3N8D9_9ENTR|nr:30S ribosomal protein S16 [Candidatus Purcelliella pentastirinorum]WDI78648.1 30S ribosomal protein S16 [Candidatus Purcelliella pentastirinorum]WDR80324.1 30S ribosomal protein S16 [Candidatus Purcelliella pentastirinorum]
MIRIRLALNGAKKKPFYNIIVTDKRNPRNGRFIEKIGFLNSITKNKIKNIKINMKRLEYWKKTGAKLSKRLKYSIKKIKQKTNANE